MNQIGNFPPIKWAMIHPRFAAWVVLSLGMVTLLVIEASDVGLEIGQWISLIVATVLVAGLCIWIVSWEDVDEDVRISTTEVKAVKIETTETEINTEEASAEA
jgi:K+ transporter